MLELDKLCKILEFLSRDDPMRCFKRVPGKVLIGLVDQLIGDVESVEECEQKCHHHSKCLSAAYYQKEKVGMSTYSH